MIQVTKTSQSTTKKNIINRISDVPGGVSIDLSTLVPGSIVLEGTPLSAPSSGMRKICKQGIILSGSTTTAVKLTEKTHHFKVGDFVCSALGGKAYAITSITNTSGVDTLNIGTAIDAVAEGGFLYEALAESANVDAKLNIAYAAGTSTGLIADATSAALKTTMPGQSTVATVVGTTTEPGNATVTVSSDLFADEVVTVAIADNDTASAAAGKMRLALEANAVVNAHFIVSGEADQIILTHRADSIGSVLKNAADVILKEAFTVPAASSQVIWIADAQVRADVYESVIGSLYLATLPGVIVIKY